MIQRVDDLGKVVAVVGFREVSIGDLRSLLNELKQFRAVVQLFDAERVAGPWHLFFAALNAMKAFRGGYNISRDLSTEVLLYASGQRQIKRAIDMLGVRPTSKSIAAVAIGDSEEELAGTIERLQRLIGGARDDSVLEISADRIDLLKSLYGISDLELEASRGGKEGISDLIIERTALLAVKAKR